jgi:hypothetical protein
MELRQLDAVTKASLCFEQGAHFCHPVTACLGGLLINPVNDLVFKVNLRWSTAFCKGFLHFEVSILWQIVIINS